jgi:hypothetical protein
MKDIAIAPKVRIPAMGAPWRERAPPVNTGTDGVVGVAEYEGEGDGVVGDEDGPGTSDDEELLSVGNTG